MRASMLYTKKNKIYIYVDNFYNIIQYRSAVAANNQPCRNQVSLLPTM